MSHTFAIPLECGDCGWTGTVADAEEGPKDLGDFSIGEPIPNAACPECDWWFVVNPDPVERAAPSLLEALRIAQPHLREYVDYHNNREGCSTEMEYACDMVEAAIAKAEASQ